MVFFFDGQTAQILRNKRVTNAPFSLARPFFSILNHDHIPEPGSMGMVQIALFLFIFDNQECENDPSSIAVKNDHVFAEISYGN